MSAQLSWETTSTGVQETIGLGQMLGGLVSPPEVIELRSDLGGGKTTFARGLVLGLGSQDKVSSPTFTLSRVYKSQDYEIHHFDFYRLKDAGVVGDQFKESLQNPKAITIVEWSDIVQNVLPEDRLTVEFTPNPGDIESRNIKFIYSPKHVTIIKMLETNLQEIEP